MKKLLKAAGALTAVAAAVAGGFALYRKFFAPEEDFDDLDEELDEEFEEDLDAPGRGYVSLTPSAEKTEETVPEEKAATVDDVLKGAAESAAEKVKAAMEQTTEESAE